MSAYDPDAEPTHAIPKELEAKLVEAKRWYDRRQELEDTIRRVGGIAQRNAEDRDRLDREGAIVLEEIVEIIDSTWGYGPGVDQ